MSSLCDMSNRQFSSLSTLGDLHVLTVPQKWLILKILDERELFCKKAYISVKLEYI